MTAHHQERALFSADAYPSFLSDPDADRRACLDTPIEVWFGDGTNRQQIGAAKALCRRCPLHIRCKNWSLSRPSAELHGIWGGMTQYEREQEKSKTKTRNCPRCNRFVRAVSGVVSRHKRLKGFGDDWAWCE